MSMSLTYRKEKMVSGKMYSVFVLKYTAPQSEREATCCENKSIPFNLTEQSMLFVLPGV